jgi:hypothetical protein
VREADHSPPFSAEVKEWLELYIHSPNTPSWRGTQLKHRNNFTFTSPPRPCRLRDPPNLLYTGYQGFFPWGWSGLGEKLTTRLHLVPRSRMCGDIPALLQYIFMASCSVKTSISHIWVLSSDTVLRLLRIILWLMINIVPIWWIILVYPGLRVGLSGF